MVTKMMALRVKYYFHDASIIFTLFSHSIIMSSMGSSRNTSISLPGYRGPEIIMVSKRYLHF